MKKVIKDEFSLFLAYHSIYVQLLEGAFKKRSQLPLDTDSIKSINNAFNLPKFQDFKDRLGKNGYCMLTPAFFERYNIKPDGTWQKIHYAGKGNDPQDTFTACRGFNYWIGIKYYTDSLDGDFNVNRKQISSALKVISK